MKQPNESQYVAQGRSLDIAPSTRSPFAIIWMFAAIVLCLLIMANFSFGVLSSVRAYVGGESRWSKAQKDAVFHLQKYAVTRAPGDLQRFHEKITVLLGDHAARIEMNKTHPDIQKVRQGFIRGGNHIDDIDGMFDLYRRFARVSFMRRAIQAWEAADHYMIQLDEAGSSLQREIESPSPSAQEILATLSDVSSINEKLTPIENQFVDALSEASRAAYQLLQAILFAAAPGLLILGTVLSLRILQQRKREDDRVHHIAFHDDLTALPNRLMLTERLDQALSRHRRSELTLAILYMNLDRFKVINDSLGHEAGDILLCLVADRLRAQLREGDSLARVGGDEFVVLIENYHNSMAVSACAQRLVEQLSAPYLLGKKDCHITVSIGISTFPADGSDSQSLLKAADVEKHMDVASAATNRGTGEVIDYLPALKGSAYDGVTIRQLLTMTSGAKWNEDYADPKSDVNQFALGEPGADGENPIVAYMAKLPREARPGTKWVYKTGESDLIGELLARATHKHPGDYLSEKIWSKFGMERDALWMLDRAGEELGGCCISMTLRDYGRFGLFFMRGGKIGDTSILPDDWIAQATRQQQPGYGFQWWVHDDGSYEAVGIFGQAIFINPAEDLIIVTSSAWPQADAPKFYAVSKAYFSAVTKALQAH